MGHRTCQHPGCTFSSTNPRAFCGHGRKHSDLLAAKRLIRQRTTQQAAAAKKRATRERTGEQPALPVQVAPAPRPHRPTAAERIEALELELATARAAAADWQARAEAAERALATRGASALGT